MLPLPAGILASRKIFFWQGVEHYNNRPANLESKKILRFLYLYCSIAVCSKKKTGRCYAETKKKKKKKKKVSTFLKNREIRSAALEQGSETVRLTVNP